MKRTKLVMSIVILTIISALFIALPSCKDDAVVSRTDNLNLSLGNPNSGMMLQGLQLKEVKVLIKDIKLQSANDPGAGPLPTVFLVGPYVLSLNLDGGMTLVGAGYIPFGKYTSVTFTIVPLDPEMPIKGEFGIFQGGYSVVAMGNYNGEDFTFKSGVFATQSIGFPKILFVDENGNTNITLIAKPSGWFQDASGSALNPLDERNRAVIENNIIQDLNQVFDAFGDNDRNGLPD